MIKFENISQQDPYIRFVEIYKKALLAKQNNIEAVCISSFSKINSEVDARFVNIKMLLNDSFIFFSNYNSPKSDQFSSHDQVSLTFYWSSINFQIRMKGNIKKTSRKISQEHFKNRDSKKNALAISSCQSQPISSFDEVIKEYNRIKGVNDLKICPEYWGGFMFKPYYFEFWHGSDSRINKREVYEFKNNLWNSYYIQP